MKSAGAIAMTTLFVMTLFVGAWYLPVHEAKTAVRQQLKDPDSANFRGVTRAGEWVCGEVNAKNAFGAYVGFRRFAASKSVAHIEDGSGGGALVELYCRNGGAPVAEPKPSSRFRESQRPRAEFVLRETASARERADPVIERKKVHCHRYFVYESVSPSAVVMVDCREISSEQSAYIIDTGKEEVAGPFAPLR